MGQKNESRLRKCVACQGMMEKKDLIRVVRDSEGGTFIDRTGKANGRGAYVCRKAECIQAAYKKSAFSRSLKCQVSDQLYEELKKELTLE